MAFIHVMNMAGRTQCTVLWRSPMGKFDTGNEIFDGSYCDPAVAISSYWSSSSI